MPAFYTKKARAPILVYFSLMSGPEHHDGHESAHAAKHSKAMEALKLTAAVGMTAAITGPFLLKALSTLVMPHYMIGALAIGGIALAAGWYLGRKSARRGGSHGGGHGSSHAPAH